MITDIESKKKTTTDTSMEESLERIEKLLREIFWMVEQSLPKPKGD